MPTYMVDSPVAWAPDVSLHAGITRLTIQNTLQATFDNSGSDYDGVLLCLSGSGYYNVIPTADWLWTNLPPQPFRLLKKQASTSWRQITVEVLGELANAGDTTLRVFAMEDPNFWVDPASGEVLSYDYCELNFTLAAQARVSDTMSPSLSDSITLSGIQSAICWLKFAVTGDEDLHVYSIRIKEVAA
jgi:hypothetical protein